MNKDILISSNDKGFLPMMVLINSILCNNTDVTFHIMQTSISEEHKDFIRNWILSKNGQVIIYDADLSFVEKMKNLRTLLPASHVTIEGFFRLYAIDKIKNVDRILYLDIDTVVDGDLTELFEINFDGNYFCAAKDSEDKDWTALKGKLGIPFSYPYVNSGVLLMNVLELKKMINEEFIINFISNNHARFSFCDQDMINKAWFHKIKIISNKYNSMCREPKGMIPAKYSGKPLIYHYTGPIKFWDKYDENCYFWGMEIYQKYLDNSFCEMICEKVKENIICYQNNIYITIENRKKHITAASNWGNCLIFYYENIKKKNKTFINYLKNYNIKKVAIYGVGEIGKFIFNEINLSKETCEVKYFIDRSAKSKDYNGVKILRPAIFQEVVPEVDAIIVAVIKESYNDIEQYLRLLNITNKMISVYQLMYYDVD